MYVRLAFAVAAHLEPEILVVDEVLAVGDVQFQKKCLGKMEDVSKTEGRTVLFVSHNMSAIQNICSKALYLSEGRNVGFGNTDRIIEKYLGQFSGHINNHWKREIKIEDEKKEAYVHAVSINTKNADQAEFFVSQEIRVLIEVKVTRPVSGISIEFFLRNADTSPVFSSFTSLQDFEPGHYIVNASIPPNLLNNKQYYIDVAISKNFSYFIDNMQNLVSFNVLDDISNLGMSVDYIGVVRPVLDWTITKRDV
jgi:lipopolysaccharide transport system ATP-binding protein